MTAYLAGHCRARVVGRHSARSAFAPVLLNRYDVILLDPVKHPRAKHAAARQFADWLTSPEGQEAIGAYTIGGEQLFHPSAAEPK